MTISARNQIIGTAKSVKKDGLVAEGKQVTVIIKSTAVLLQSND